ncbi:ATP-dependent sacrificial sulfur transferase LarE [Clostridiaceae bacterium 35-E11]
MTLIDFFKKSPQVAVAFSGGVDSSYLLHEAKKYACRIHAYTIHSPFQPAFEIEDAKHLAEKLEVPMTIIPADILAVPEVVENGPNRCYYCKQAAFSLILKAAKADGFSLVIDGTNASDDVNDRPGMKALKELQVRSPLRECGLSKAAIREASKKAGLFTHDKPSYACLATRIPTGSSIQLEDLKRVEAAENRLFALGFKGFRARLMGNMVRLELPENQFELLIRKRQDVQRELSYYFERIVLDLEPREE